MKADRRTKQYAIGAIACEVAAVAVALTNNLTRWFSDPLNDVTQLLATAGMVLVGAAGEALRRLNTQDPKAPGGESL